MPAPIALLACRVLENEILHFSAGQSHLVHFEFFDMGLHDQPGVLRTTLAAALAKAEAQPHIETVALVYGVCGMGTVGLAPRRCRLVVPRAHDCLTLLLGSKERYAEIMRKTPGVHWFSPGWVSDRRVPGPERDAALRAAYTAKFGAEEAEELLVAEYAGFNNFACAAYTDLGLPGGDEARTCARRCAEWLRCPFLEHPGDPGLLRDLLAGAWDEARFLIVEPGQCTAFSPDSRILKAVTATP